MDIRGPPTLEKHHCYKLLGVISSISNSFKKHIHATCVTVRTIDLMQHLRANHYLIFTCKSELYFPQKSNDRNTQALQPATSCSAVE